MSGGELTFTEVVDAANQFAFVGWDGGDLAGDGLGGIDLTEGGKNDRFIWELVALDQSDLTGWVNVRDMTGESSRWLLQSLVTPADAPGSIEFRFEDVSDVFPVNADLTSVHSINIRLSLSSPGSVTLGSIQVIPEPRTLLLVSAGLLVLPLCRRLRHTAQPGIPPALPGRQAKF